MKTNNPNISTLIFAVQLAFAAACFLGIFWNYIRIEVYDQQHWYYINRGYPTPWSGVSQADALLNWPVVPAPFLTIHSDTVSLIKIIDLSVFLPLLAILTLVAFPIVKIVIQTISAHKAATVIFRIGHFLLLFIDVFFYFFWLSRF